MDDPRIELDPSEYTLRTKLVAAINEAILATPFKKGTVIANDQDKLFEFGGTGVLEDINRSQTPGFRLEEGEEGEPVEDMYPLVKKTFRLYVHFKVVQAEGVDPSPMINYYFARITDVLVTPNHFADIATDVTEAGNTPQMQGLSDPEPGGSIWFDIEYRHGRGNYFSEIGNDG